MNLAELSPIIWWLFACSLVAVALYLAVRLATAVVFYRQQQLLKQDKTIIHEYTAPPDLTPAEMGYIFDRRFGIPELSATVVQLLQQNVLTAHHAGNQLQLSLTSKKRQPNLDWVALEVIGFISSKQRRISWHALVDELGLYQSFQQSLEKQVKRQLVSKEYLTDSDAQTEDLVRKWVRNVLGLVLSLGFVLIPINQVFSSSRFGVGNGYGDIDYALVFLLATMVLVVLWPLWNSYVDLLVRIYMNGSGLPLDATSKLRREWGIISGYRIYLLVVESQRQKSSPTLHADTLAWCMVFGQGPSLDEAVKASRNS